MKFLYAPWRGSYAGADKTPETALCVLCHHETENEKDTFILYRGRYAYVMLNLYPYNTGHILVVPYVHGADFATISREVRTEIMELIFRTSEILKKALEAQGFNIGINIGGKVAGGSIPDHLHFHVIPRWEGDTSFLVSLADTKPISHDLRSIYTQLLPYFEDNA